MPTPSSFAALLLAGGRSRRMGKDKALLEWRGQPLWQTQLEKLRSLSPAHLWIACRPEQNLNQDRWLGDSAAFLHDPPGEDLGPIAAIGRALALSELPLLVLAVDTPLITVDFLRAITAKACGGSFFYRSTHGIEPLPGLYGPTMRPLLEGAIRSHELSLKRVIQSAAGQNLAWVEPLPADGETLFENANTPDQWNRLQAHSPAD